MKSGFSSEWVYNFEVANTHTYFVSQQGVLVHNINPENPCAELSSQASRPRLYQNLFPADTPNPIKPSILKNEGGKWVEVLPNGQVRTASGRYNFVAKDGTLYGKGVTKKFGVDPIGHVDLAQGGWVDYARQVQFSGRTNRGQIRWWNNESGHYAPIPDTAPQAGLPINKFRAGEFDGPQQIGTFKNLVKK